MTGLAELLAPYETRDETLLAVFAEVVGMLAASERVRQLEHLDVAIIDFEAAPAELVAKHEAFTPNCMAISADNLVLINQAFIHDTEIAVRAFALAGSVIATPYLQREEEMFGLIKRAAAERATCLTQMRALADSPDFETRIRRELSMALLFYVAHEIGHLLAGEDRHAFGRFIDPNAALETQLAAATAKFSRHVDELRKFGFYLADFEPMMTIGSEIRQRADELLAQLPSHERINQDFFFAAEVSADELAEAIMIECLAASPSNEADPRAAYVVATRALFAAAMFSWFQDLLAFLDKSNDYSDNPAGVATLIVSLMRDRYQYVRASSLFGEAHRFTLLRAKLAIEAILRASTSYFDRPDDERTIWYSGPDPRQRDEADALQRYCMSCILMDTAVKIATMGASTAWMLINDKERGTPQVFMMQFYSLVAELRRLRRWR